MPRYKIVRYYLSEKKQEEVIKKGLTLEEAQAHCKNPSTHVDGVYFDGYTEEK